MMNRFFLASLALVACAAPALAFPFGLPFGGSSVDMSGVWSLVAGVLGPVLGAAATGIIAYAGAYAAKHWKVQIDAAARDTLHSAAETGIDYALSKVGGLVSGKSIDVKSPLVAMAVEWVISVGAPGAMKQLGVSPATVEKLVVAKLQALFGAVADAPAAAAPAAK